MMDIVICFVTCPSKEVGAALAKIVVAERLAACVNIIDSVQSVYQWKDEIVIDSEVLLMIKTTEGRVETLRERMLENHPYDLPEFIVIRSSSSSEAYARWIQGCVG
jgi:periplasmic divalent cation tolerance protein